MENKRSNQGCEDSSAFSL